MPAPRKVDLLPEELKGWLQEELRSRGFAGYEEVAEALNWKLEEAGLDLRIQKSALHEFGQQHREFIKLQDASSKWAEGWLAEQGLAEEAKRHNVLFQMITALAFKVMQAQMTREAEEIDPKELHFLGRMMKDVMGSAAIREQTRREVEKEVRAKLEREMAAKIDDAEAAGELDAVAAEKARVVMGFAQ